MKIIKHPPQKEIDEAIKNGPFSCISYTVQYDNGRVDEVYCEPRDYEIEVLRLKFLSIGVKKEDLEKYTSLVYRNGMENGW